jgi:hypothetical protein
MGFSLRGLAPLDSAVRSLERRLPLGVVLVSIKNTDSPLQGLIHYQRAQQKDPGISRMTFPACPLGFGPLQGFLFVAAGEKF